MSSPDALTLLRSSIAANKPPILTTSSDSSDAVPNQTESLVQATHLFFSHTSPICLPLSTPTRFESTNPDTSLVNLLSIFFAWQQKDVPVPEYISKSGDLNKELPDGQKVRNLVFVERLDLITWLEGASEDSEYIKPVEGAVGDGDVARAADVAGGVGVPIASGTGVGVTQTIGGRPVKVIDARLQAIYNNERRMGDHNTVLRGIKPTVRITPEITACPY
jgi:parafibromin